MVIISYDGCDYQFICDIVILTVIQMESWRCQRRQYEIVMCLVSRRYWSSRVFEILGLVGGMTGYIIAYCQYSCLCSSSYLPRDNCSPLCFLFFYCSCHSYVSSIFYQSDLFPLIWISYRSFSILDPACHLFIFESHVVIDCF